MLSSFKRRSIFALAMALSIGAMSMAVASPAQAQPAIASGHVYNGGSPRCLDSGTPTNAQLWTCSTSIYQQWAFPYASGRMIGNSPTGCLDGGAGTNGTPVPLVACTGVLSQSWTYDPGYRLVNRYSGRCLDADLGTIGHGGTKVQVWDCGSGTNQQWFFENP
ncbi:MAG TPA: RICIN domain-containing protein [Thermoanaerobaculia bacterium]|nr:RICIN domain-containing protein [Thermoanaerobaculia bacterium]